MCKAHRGGREEDKGRPMSDDDAPTDLDRAFTAMDADPGDDAARLRYYARLADGMLFLLLEAEPKGGALRPRVFQTEDGPLVLAFDREERLADAAGGVVAYAELPGRVIAAQLAGQGAALGINLGVADSAFLVSSDALGWLATLLDRSPETTEARPQTFSRPTGLPEALLGALDAKLGRAHGLASGALLSEVQYADGRRGHMLAFLDAVDGAEAALARAASEALTFSGLDAGELDVTFLASGGSATVAMARVALRFDLARAEDTPGPGRSAPGSDPNQPPKLR